jgi:hypothetical protein
MFTTLSKGQYMLVGHVFVWLLLFGSLVVGRAVDWFLTQGLTLKARLTLNSQSYCCLPSAGITVMYYYTRLILVF